MKLRTVRKTKAGKTAAPVRVKLFTLKWGHFPARSRLLRIPVARPVRALLVDEIDQFDQQTADSISLMGRRLVRTFAATKETT